MATMSQEELDALLNGNHGLSIASGPYSGMKSAGSRRTPETRQKERGGASSLPEMALSKGAAVAKKQKYNATPTEFLGRRYASKREAKYAATLDATQKAGGLRFWLRQVPFDLPGKARYWLDFALIENDGTVTWVEVKGRDLPMGKLKRKQVEEIYHVKIEVV